MMILVHSSPTTLAPYRTENLGVLCSPRRVYGAEMEGWPWAADNDAFSKWDEDKYLAMLDRITGRRGCLFVTAPDVVGSWRETLDLFYGWVADLKQVGQPIALVAQDGLRPNKVPWNSIDALFIGGNTEWKLGGDVDLLVYTAKHKGKWVHFGRVNSYRRARHAWSLSCDSMDGSQFNWFRDTKLAPFLNKPMLPRAASYQDTKRDAED